MPSLPNPVEGNPVKVSLRTHAHQPERPDCKEASQTPHSQFLSFCPYSQSPSSPSSPRLHRIEIGLQQRLHRDPAEGGLSAVTACGPPPDSNTSRSCSASMATSRSVMENHRSLQTPVPSHPPWPRETEEETDGKEGWPGRREGQ